MRASPGGVLAANEVVGRDELIDQLWTLLEGQSIVLSAERRMGKTSVVRKMKQECRPSFSAIFQDLEKVWTVREFVETLHADIAPLLSLIGRSADRFQKLLSALGSVEIAGLKLPEVATPHWKPLLVSLLEDLNEHTDRPVVFFWDELPLMLQHIIMREGEETAMELLDVLRASRTLPRIRMVFTGSIGLHHVLSSLKQAGNPNAPVNDMFAVDLPELSPEHSCELALRLLAGEGFPAESLEDVAREIGQAVDHVPYYIHHVVRQLKAAVVTPGLGDAERIVDEFVVRPEDTWQFTHYVERVATYYAGEDQDYARGLLDTIAVAEGPLTFAEAFQRLKAQLVTADTERARSMVTLLQRDHYLRQEKDGRYRFRYELIRRAWAMRRGLI